jgi:hypothetical protein
MKLTGENRSTRGKTCPSATLSTTNLTWTDPGSNLVPLIACNGRGLCNEPIPRPVESYRLWCVSQCDQKELQTSTLKRETGVGRRGRLKKKILTMFQFIKPWLILPLRSVTTGKIHVNTRSVLHSLQHVACYGKIVCNLCMPVKRKLRLGIPWI